MKFDSLKEYFEGSVINSVSLELVPKYPARPLTLELTDYHVMNFNDLSGFMKGFEENLSDPHYLINRCKEVGLSQKRYEISLSIIFSNPFGSLIENLDKDRSKSFKEQFIHLVSKAKSVSMTTFSIDDLHLKDVYTDFLQEDSCSGISHSFLWRPDFVENMPENDCYMLGSCLDGWKDSGDNVVMFVRGYKNLCESEKYLYCKNHWDIDPFEPVLLNIKDGKVYNHRCVTNFDAVTFYKVIDNPPEW